MVIDRRIDALAVGLMTLPVVAALIVWGQLPSQMAVHWNGATPDVVLSKPMATVGLLLFGIAAIVATRLAPDSLTNTPGGENVTIVFVGIVFTYVQTIILVWNMGYRFDVGLAILPVLLIGGLLVIYSDRLPSR